VVLAARAVQAEFHLMAVLAVLAEMREKAEMELKRTAVMAEKPMAVMAEKATLEVEVTAETAETAVKLMESAETQATLMAETAEPERMAEQVQIALTAEMAEQAD
jgi:hypothetical protein